VKPVPVYIVYFDQAALVDGSIVEYRDMYGRDSNEVAALNMKDGGASIAPPKPKPADQVAARPKSRPEGKVAAKPKPKPADEVATR
jgi:hypothetical protein